MNSLNPIDSTNKVSVVETTQIKKPAILYFANLPIPYECKSLTVRQWSFMHLSQLLQKKPKEQRTLNDFKLLALILSINSEEECTKEVIKTCFQSMLKDPLYLQERSLIIGISMLYKDHELLDLKMEQIKTFEASANPQSDVDIYKKLTIAFESIPKNYGQYLQLLIKRLNENSQAQLEDWGLIEGVKDEPVSRKKQNQKTLYRVMENKKDLAFLRKCYEIKQILLNSLKLMISKFDFELQYSKRLILNMGSVDAFLAEISQQCLSFFLHANVLNKIIKKEKQAIKETKEEFPCNLDARNKERLTQLEQHFDKAFSNTVKKIKEVFKKKGFQEKLDAEEPKLQSFFDGLKPNLATQLKDNASAKELMKTYFQMIEVYFNDNDVNTKPENLKSWEDCLAKTKEIFDIVNNLVNSIISEKISLTGSAAVELDISLEGVLQNCEMQIQDAVELSFQLMKACRTHIDILRRSIAGAAAQSDIDAYAIFEELEDFSLNKLEKGNASQQPFEKLQPDKKDPIETEEKPSVKSPPIQSKESKLPPLSAIESLLLSINSNAFAGNAMELIRASSRYFLLSIPGFSKPTSNISDCSDVFLSRKESVGHLFHACCSLEQLSDALLKNDLEGVSAIFPLLIMDWHVLAEQHAVSHLLKAGNLKPDTHSLKCAFQACRMWDRLPASAQRHLTNIDQALLWSRYPNSSLYRSSPGKQAEGLQWMEFCLDLQAMSMGVKPSLPKAELSKRLSKFVKFVVKSHGESMRLFINPELNTRIHPEANKLIELFSENGPIERNLLAAVNKTVDNYFSNNSQGSHFIAKDFELAIAKIQELEKESLPVRSEDAVFKAILGDAKHHIWRLNKCMVLMEGSNDKRLNSWHSRNLMNIQWIIEQLYLARYFTAEHQVQYIHDFKLFQMLLGDDVNNPRAKGHEKLDLDKILSCNFGIGIHYPWKMAHSRKECLEFAQAMEADQASYIEDDGFKPSHKTRTAEAGENLLHRLKSRLPEGLAQGVILLNLLKKEGP